MLFWTLDFERKKGSQIFFWAMKYQKKLQIFKKYWKTPYRRVSQKRCNFAPCAANHTSIWLTLYIKSKHFHIEIDIHIFYLWSFNHLYPKLWLFDRVETKLNESTIVVSLQRYTDMKITVTVPLFKNYLC